MRGQRGQAVTERRIILLKLKLGELYGFDSIEELMEAIDALQDMGMSDEELNKMLERSEQGKKESEDKE